MAIADKTSVSALVCAIEKYKWCIACLFRYPECEESADIVFALDASGSIGNDNFEKMVDFTRSVIQGLSIGMDGVSRPTRVGMLTYSDDVTRVFNLNDYDNKYDVLNALPPYYKRGTTDTAAAIE